MWFGFAADVLLFIGAHVIFILIIPILRSLLFILLTGRLELHVVKYTER